MTRRTAPVHISCQWRVMACLFGGLLLTANGLFAQAAPPLDGVPAEVLASEAYRIAAIERACRAAVCVFGQDANGGGSGVVITPDGYALTNFHVAQPCGNFMKCGMSDGRLYDAVIVGVDPTGDVALLKLEGRDDFPTAEMSDSDLVQVGDWCFAVGNPFLLATDFQPTVTYGMVSGVHRYQYPAGTLLEYADCIQTDAAINPGNSGGPLFNAHGQLIGINGRGSFEKRGRVNVGVGYAISINQIKLFLGYLRSGRIVDHATLGAIVTTDDRGRVVVSNISTRSDAYRRGIRYGDEILAFGGRRITTVNGFKNALGIFPKGWRVPVTYQRGGQRFDVLVRLEGVHRPEELISSVQRPSAPPPPRPRPRPDEPNPDQPEQPPEPPGPNPHPNRSSGAEDAIPAEVRAKYEARRGYANYYFNRLERDRVWQAFLAHGEFSSLDQPWTLSGSAADSKVEIQLGPETVFGRFPDGPARIDVTTELGNQLQPIGSGGLLVALHLWKRLLVLGPEKFGQVYYLGQAPLMNHTGLFDVLVGTHDVIECRFYFDPATGHLAAMEMFPDADADPCEVHFGDYQEVAGRAIPRMIEVHFAGQVYGVIKIEAWKWEQPADATEKTSAPREDIIDA